MGVADGLQLLSAGQIGKPFFGGGSKIQMTQIGTGHGWTHQGAWLVDAHGSATMLKP